MTWQAAGAELRRRLIGLPFLQRLARCLTERGVRRPLRDRSAGVVLKMMVGVAAENRAIRSAAVMGREAVSLLIML